MANVLIKPINHTGGNNDDFVGMKFVSIDGKPFVQAIFPLGYHYTSIDNPCVQEAKGTQVALKKELYSLLCIIKQHSLSGEGKLEGTTTYNNDFPFNAYMTIIKAFMQYGYYIESETRYKNAQIGKINWKRTIAQIKPAIQDDCYPVYTNFIIRQNEKKVDKLISLIHEWCVYEAFTKLGWILTSFSPHKPMLNISDDKKEREYFIQIINNSLKTTFNDRNKLLFNAMISMLKAVQSENKNSFFYGTTHFHTVWENLIDVTYGIPKAEKRKYFPPAEWVIGNRRKENKLYPDTIMLSEDGEEDIFVLDAKYYSYVIWEMNLPSAADINKQVTYGAYAAHELLPTPSAVYNAFLIPYDFERDPHKLGTKGCEYFYIGFSRMLRTTSDKPYERVLGILVDTKMLIQNAGNLKKTDLANFIRANRMKAQDMR